MMGADMKEMIADTTRRLLTKKCRGKLTVTEIVEECNITRQAFYYHFEDVPALIRWILEKDEEKMLREALAQQNAEQGLLYLFRMASAITPYIQDQLPGGASKAAAGVLSAFYGKDCRKRTALSR